MSSHARASLTPAAPENYLGNVTRCIFLTKVMTNNVTGTYVFRDEDNWDPTTFVRAAGHGSRCEGVRKVLRKTHSL